MGEELSIQEKAELMGRHDISNQDDYDEDLFKALVALREPSLNDIQDRARRAIALFIQVVQDGIPDQDFPPGSYLLEGFMMGLVAGRYLKPDIFKKGKEPK
jgi:hypothetical protein